MAKKFLLKRSSVPGKVPSTNDIAIGELAVNLVDQIIYTKRISPADGTTEEVVPVGGLGGDGAAIYEILLAASDFAQETYSIFDKNNPDPELIDNTGVFSSMERYYVYDTNQYFITDNIILNGGSFSAFEIFINTAQDTANYKVEYSIDGGTNWIEINEPYRVYLDSDTSDFRIKFTSLTDGTVVYGYSVLYDLQGMQGTNVVAFDEFVTLTSDISAGTVYELPHDRVYNPDGKSLEVFRNGVKLANGVHFSEEDSTHIKWLIDLNTGDELEFKQYYGYVFIDQDHVANVLTLQWNYRDKNSDYTATNGDYIFADTSGGSFTITLPANPRNGDTIFINDVKGTFDTNNLDVESGGDESIMSDESGVIHLDVAYKEYKFIYNALNSDWRVV